MRENLWPRVRAGQDSEVMARDPSTRSRPSCVAGRPGRVARSPVVHALVLAGALIASPSSARAQVGLEGGTGNNLDIEHFQPRPLGFVGPGRAHTLDWGEYAVGGFIHYAQNPLVLFADRLQIGEIVRHRLSLDLVGTVGLLPWLEAQVALPFTVYQSGDPDLPTGDLATAGLRDLRLAVKAAPWSQVRGDLIGLAARVEVTLPTGDADAFLGDGAVGFRPSVIVDRSFDWLWGVRFAGALGLRVRPDTEIGNVGVFDEWDARLAAALGLPEVLDARPFAFVELAGTTKLDDPFADAEQSPLIGRIGLRVEHDLASGERLHGTGGMSAGATRGYGAPDYRLFAGLVYERFHGDRDGDGFLDHEDGCPDEPEDFDGLADDDGCPEVDADEDGVPDVDDACPETPEDLDDFVDHDGCPDPDNDQDGIADVDDACPLDPEDLDGFDDEDGCPEEDSDQDGIVDAEDECPDEKETINGFEDEDGCPDEGEPQVEVTSEKVTISSKVNFAFDSAEISPDSHALLNQVALTIKANPQLRHIRVEGHTDERGPEAYNRQLSQARAESVMRYLVKRGVSPDRLEAVGYGESVPLVPGTGEAAWARNRRVEFTILGAGGEAPRE
jgi:outer membrane protein OmpA-like peptidoglycan-associated protein